MLKCMNILGKSQSNLLNCTLLKKIKFIPKLNLQLFFGLIPIKYTIMNKIYLLVFSLVFIISCNSIEKKSLNHEVMTALGSKYKIEFGELVKTYEAEIEKDSLNVESYIGLAESHILLYVFGYVSRDISIPKAKVAFEKGVKLDSLSSNVLKMQGILSFLDWQWEDARISLLRAIEENPKNLNARHWYSLWLSAMGRFDEAMAQSDTIKSMDTAGDYLIGRGSLLYFQYRFEEMKPLMIENIAKDPSIPWGHDWLGMAYNGLGEHEDAISTYFKAFELSNGTVEIGAGLGHALGQAGEKELAKQMADYYTMAAKENYLPPCQRSFIHISIGEHEMAIDLLEQAYEQQSWFLIFIQIEHWYDPIRTDPRFIAIMNKMGFPNKK